ncbi:MAG: nucleotidyltransferase family protein [Myxococcota bacterium]
MTTLPSHDALILAGRRGEDDDLARATGAPHRALLDFDGTPMLERVVAALEASASVGSIWVSTDAPDLVRQAGGLGDRIAAGSLRLLASTGSPSGSVTSALDSIDSPRRLLVTTADHALLSPGIVETFLSKADAREADLCVGLVEEASLRERFPDSKRTLIPFRGARYSGANLFALQTPEARRVIEFWRRAERDRKQPWRLVYHFGPTALLLFALRRLDLEQALARASRSLGARVAAVVLPQAEAAIDVDRLEDYALAQRILAERSDP